MLDKPCLQIKSVAAEDNGEHLVLRMNIHNAENRTVYAYAVPRRILYDAATKTLTVCMHDNHLPDDSHISRHLREPKVMEMEANKDTEMMIPLKRVLHRLKASRENADKKAGIEVLNIFEAQTVRLEIAHQDTPFYFNPKTSMIQQLKMWGKPISIISAQIGKKRGEQTDERNTPPKKKKGGNEPGSTASA